MPLTLKLTMEDRLSVGGRTLRLIKIGPGRHASFRLDEEETIEIAEDPPTEIVPGVFFGLADRSTASVRIEVIAPRGIAIRRLRTKPGLEDL